MLTFGSEAFPSGISSILCLGAHSDDIEIGCGGTVIRLLERRPDLKVTWVVLSAEGEREEEARRSAERLLAPARDATIHVKSFRQRFFPHLIDLKEYFDELGRLVSPSVVFTHRREDLHQDHRVVSELTDNTFRDQLVLQYEIPKYDADLGRPNVFVHLSREVADEKVGAILKGFPTQQTRPWFTEETFRALLRLRGIESKAPDGYAEGFHARKLVLM